MKNSPRKNMVSWSPSLTKNIPITDSDFTPNPDYGSGLQIQENLVYDGLKIGQDLPYSYMDNFSRDKIKNKNSALRA